MKMMLSKKGFTLMELIVVMGIIATLMMVLAPKLSGISQKAQATAARVELTSLNAFEGAFYLQNNTYTSNLGDIGYVPDGYAPDAFGCPTVSAPVAGNGNDRSWSVGFSALSGVPGRKCNGTASGSGEQFVLFRNATTSTAPAVAEMGTSTATSTTYTAGASNGNILIQVNQLKSFTGL